MSLPPWPPAPFLPRGMALSRKCNTSCTGEALVQQGANFFTQSFNGATLIYTLCPLLRDSECKLVFIGRHTHTHTHTHANTLQLDLSLHLSLFGVYKSLYLCLCSHSPCPSYIPKEAITSLASASP